MKFKNIKDMTDYIFSTNTWWDDFIMLPQMNWLRWIIYTLPSVPRDTYLNIKWFIQRGKRGYSENDTWGLSYYLSNVISNGIKDLKSNLNGYPMNYKSIKNWKLILTEIQWTFDIANKIMKHEYSYLTSKQRTKKIINFNKQYDIHTMTKTECKRYRNGWRLFQKHYMDIWD